MTSNDQVLANRTNAQKSTGPRTNHGKLAVSSNALTHGLSTRRDVIAAESQAEFDLYRDQMLDELSPTGPTESMLADRIVSLSWRLKRADRIQNQTINALHALTTAPNPLAKLTRSTPPNRHPALDAAPTNPPTLPVSLAARGGVHKTQSPKPRPELAEGTKQPKLNSSSTPA